MFEIIAFYIFAALTIGMFAIVVMSRNALYSMSALAGGMIFISGFFFILDAEFLGVVQIVVYSGAIMALYAFGMMFFDTTRDVSEKMRSKKIAYTLSVISAILVVAILCAPLVSENIQASYPSRGSEGLTLQRQQRIVVSEVNTWVRTFTALHRSTATGDGRRSQSASTAISEATIRLRCWPTCATATASLVVEPARAFLSFMSSAVFQKI